MKRFAVIAVLGGAIASSAFGINILVNPGFETGTLAGWTTSGHVATSSQAQSGTFSSFAGGNFFIQQSFAAVANNTITEVSVWALQPNRSSYFYAFELHYSDSSNETVLGSGTPANVWTQHNFTGALDVGKSLVMIRAWGYTSGNPNQDHTYFDNFVVNSTVPEPATMAALGFGAIALLRRKRK